MAPSKSGKTAAKPKKEKIYHPESRKAGQLARTHLRKGKLTHAASNRSKKFHSQVDVYGFFYHAIPDQGNGVLSLPEVHALVRDIWLTRHDAELEEERAARRRGRPKSAKENKLEDIKLREAEDYRTGMEVIDLTHAPTIDLFRRWDQKELAFVEQLRFIRISSAEPDVVVISRPGKHCTLRDALQVENDGSTLDQQKDNQRTDMLGTAAESSPRVTIQGVQGPVLPSGIADSPSQFASSMMMMDGPIS